jgi:hypothetical protein
VAAPRATPKHATASLLDAGARSTTSVAAGAGNILEYELPNERR